MMSGVELRHLEYFVAVAEELSFTRASRRLHVVQSGVSSAVAALERELGAALFDRDRHSVALTEAGRALLPEARAIVDRAFASAGIDRQVAFEVGYYTTAAGLVGNGLGVAFVPASAAAGLEGVARVPVAALAWQIQVATASARRPSAAARAFLAELLGRQ